MIDRRLLQDEAKKIGLELNERQCGEFDLYAQLLVEWNEKMNLTAITEPKEIVIKHFVDSLALLSVLPVGEGARVIDVGTGAGFPGIPLKIARPDIELVLLDSLGKRVTFLKEVSLQLGQENECIHMRAEDGGKHPAYREQFDLATARAVAHLRELSEYCLPFVKTGGFFAAMKGGDVEQETAEAERAIRELGGKIERKERLMLPDGSGRTIILIKKISRTSPKYPRPHAKIAKYPLD